MKRISRMKKRQVKLQIPKAVLSALQELADKRGNSLSDTIRHCVNTETYFNEQLEKGHKIIVQDNKGEVWKVVFSHLK